MRRKNVTPFPWQRTEINHYRGVTIALDTETIAVSNYDLARKFKS